MKLNLFKIEKCLKGNWLTIILAVVLLFCLASCGSIQKNKQSKAVEQQKTEVVDSSESSETDKKTETEKETKTDTNYVTEETDEETTIRPIDKDKPMTVDGKEYQNVEINKRKTSKKSAASEQKQEIEKSKTNELSKIDKSEKTASKEVYSERSTEKSKQSKSSIWVDLWWLWLLLLVILGINIYRKVT